MAAHTIFAEPMKHKCFLRVTEALYQRCAERGREIAQSPTSVARTWIQAGLETPFAIPAVIHAPFPRNLNVLLREEDREAIERHLPEAQRRLGQSFDVGVYARRLLLLGMQAHERSAAQPAKRRGRSDG